MNVTHEKPHIDNPVILRGVHVTLLSCIADTIINTSPTVRIIKFIIYGIAYLRSILIYLFTYLLTSLRDRASKSLRLIFFNAIPRQYPCPYGCKSSSSMIFKFSGVAIIVLSTMKSSAVA